MIEATAPVSQRDPVSPRGPDDASLSSVPASDREVFVARDTRRAGAITKWRRRVSWPLGIYTTPVVVLIVWEILANVGWIGQNDAPAPSAIVGDAVDLWNQGVLGPDIAISLQRAALGFLLGASIGAVTGTSAGLLRAGENLFNGIVQVFNTIPLLALLPLFVVWFGIDELPKVLIIAFGAFVPMYLNLFAAIRGVDQRLVEMARVNDAGTARLITRVLLPGSLPGFFTGLRFSLAYSVLALVAAETVNADQGLGFLISNGQTYLQTLPVFVGLVIYSLIGLLVDQFVRTLQRVFLRWRPSYEAR
ncbi:MAG TPA: ABC transporter permease [Pseudonocardia sp.]